ncbi:MAG: xanthine dehydrogenase family protein molybdopterin-binding subunit [Rubrivivax sp.]|nr:xanthine dehydrogenase family protein molybdopterin-binding subunit [Rubrivivax sp.]
MKKRTFLLGAVIFTGALGIGWSLRAPRGRLMPDGGPLAARAGETVFNGWVKITQDDRVIVQVPKSEMGQGILTSLALVLADEMDADWSRVSTEHPPLDPIYNNLATLVDGLPFHPDDRGWIKRSAGWMTAKLMREIGVQMTGGSSSIKDLWLPMREAGATARALLVGAAARRWKVPQDECRVHAGEVSHANSAQKARFGELAVEAAALPLPERVTLKTPDQFKLIGRETPRLERVAKSRGQASFGIDVRLPGMLYASVRMCPTLGGRARSFEGSAAQALPGVKKVVSFDGLHGGTGCVAVLAQTPWQAMKGVEAVKIDWDHGPVAGFDSAEALNRMAQALQPDSGFGYHEVGDVQTALKGAARTLEAEYRAPWLAHMTMEPMNCTVQIREGKATVWAPTQVPGLARMAVHRATGLDTSAIDVRVQLLGGGFGRRLEVDFIAQAAAIAQHGEGAPVQTFWNRAEDTQHDFYRPAAVARFKAGFDAQGALVAWHNVSIGQSIVHQVLRRLFGAAGMGPDKTTSEGAFDQAYEWPAARIAHEITDLPVPVGFWRAVGHSHQAFFKEGFIDECAASAKADPVAFREALLKQHPRHAAVLRKAAQMAQWGTPRPAGPGGEPRAVGVALHQSFGSIVAQVAEVSLSADKRIRVHRVWCAVDCGTPVNPTGIRQQMESGVIYGLSAALFGGVSIEKGQVRQSNFHDMPALRFDESPQIFTEILPSTEHPEGMGEPGLPPIAPAVANAVFALNGQRLRSLPLQLA